MERMTDYLRSAGLAAALLLPAACGDGPTGAADEGLGRADAAFLAVQLSGLGARAMDDEARRFGVGGAERSGWMADVGRGPALLRARSCPAGGSLDIDGEVSFSFGGGVLELSFEAVKSMDDCSFERGDDVLTVNGEVEISGSRRRVDGEPSGPQTTEVEGSLAVTRASTGETRECEIDISSVFDPETGSREVTGSFCGHDVSERADA